MIYLVAAVGLAIVALQTTLLVVALRAQRGSPQAPVLMETTAAAVPDKRSDKPTRSSLIWDQIKQHESRLSSLELVVQQLPRIYEEEADRAHRAAERAEKAQQRRRRRRGGEEGEPGDDAAPGDAEAGGGGQLPPVREGVAGPHDVEAVMAAARRAISMQAVNGTRR